MDKETFQKQLTAVFKRYETQMDKALVKMVTRFEKEAADRQEAAQKEKALLEALLTPEIGAVINACVAELKDQANGWSALGVSDGARAMSRAAEVLLEHKGKIAARLVSKAADTDWVGEMQSANIRPARK